MFWSRINFRSGILTVTRRIFGGALAPAKRTVTVLSKVPVFPARLTVTLISPPVCGNKCHGLLGSGAEVQPHDGLASLITTSASEVLVTPKMYSAVVWFAVVFVSRWSALQTNCVSGFVCALADNAIKAARAVKKIL